jgi:hypothetical protein
VELERLSVRLRPRNPWEAMDLGFAMVRAWFRQVYAPWLMVFAPLCALALALLPPQWAWVGMWWLKPALDRVVLHVLSNGVFGDLPSWRQTLRALRGAMRPGLLLSLTLYRFDFARSFNLPIWQLERQRGQAARARAKLLHRRTRGHAVWLTVACLHFESLLLFSGIALFDLLVPATMDSRFDLLSLLTMEPMGGLREYVVGVLYGVALTIVEPLYVAGGFALYLNRRTALEGWDLEVQLRRLGERPRGTRHGLGAAASLAVMLALGCMLLGAGQPAQAQSPAPGRLAPDSRAAQAAREVLARPEFSEHETQIQVQYLGPRKEARRKDDPSRIKWLETLGIGLADLLRALAWVLLAILVAFLLYFIARRLDLGGLWSRRARSDYAPPDTLFGLDVRPESLPQDIAAEAAKLARAGKLRQALSLLYRGTLITLLHRDGLELESGDTEDDCLRKSTRRIAAPAHAYFGRLLLAWQRLAYARRAVPGSEVEALCSDWAAHFRR